MDSFFEGDHMKKLFLIGAIVSMLAACGGGGAGIDTAGADTSTAGAGTNTVTCNKPTEQGPEITVSGSASNIDYAALPKLQNVTVSGDTGKVKFKDCTFVKSLTIKGSANNIEFDASSDVQEIVFAVNSGANTVTISKASPATVLDLGNANTVTRKN
jgi:hypothetical protein